MARRSSLQFSHKSAASRPLRRCRAEGLAAAGRILRAKARDGRRPSRGQLTDHHFSGGGFAPGRPGEQAARGLSDDRSARTGLAAVLLDGAARKRYL
jgi:hypothetical protein